MHIIRAAVPVSVLPENRLKGWHFFFQSTENNEWLVDQVSPM